MNKIGSYSFNYSNMSRYAQPGDLISFDTHYAIFISADSSNGIYVLDSNWAWSSYGQCRVSKHYIPYSSYYTATINRSTNAPSISPDPTTPPDVENGNWQYRVTGSAGLNVRSGPSTDYPVLTAIPKGTIVTVTLFDATLLLNLQFCIAIAFTVAELLRTNAPLYLLLLSVGFEPFVV